MHFSNWVDKTQGHSRLAEKQLHLREEEWNDDSVAAQSP